jgi:hypothetical protein
VGTEKKSPSHIVRRYRIFHTAVNSSVRVDRTKISEVLTDFYRVALEDFSIWLHAKRQNERAALVKKTRAQEILQSQDGIPIASDAQARVGARESDDLFEDAKINWWDFRLQLRYGRLWKRIVQTKKEQTYKEWEDRSKSMYMEKRRIHLAPHAQQTQGNMAQVHAAAAHPNTQEQTETDDHRELDTRAGADLADANNQIRRDRSGDNEDISMGEPHREGVAWKATPPQRDRSGSIPRTADAYDDTRSVLIFLLTRPRLGLSGLRYSSRGSDDARYRETDESASRVPASNEGVRGGVASGQDVSSRPQTEPADTSPVTCSPNESRSSGTASRSGPQLADTNPTPRDRLSQVAQSGKQARVKLSEEEGRRYTERIREKMRERLGEEGYFSYQMIGECYLHGMMDGEAILCQNEGGPDGKPIESVVFEIR